MVIRVYKNTTAEELNEALKKLQRVKKKGVGSFYGKLKGAFGDGMEYQKMIRDE